MFLYHTLFYWVSVAMTNSGGDVMNYVCGMTVLRVPVLGSSFSRAELAKSELQSTKVRP